MSPKTPGAETILAEAVELSDPADRAAYLDRACGGDAALRRHLGRLANDHFRAGNFLERPAVAAPAETAAFLPADDGGPAVGTRVGPYALRELLGEGGMGLVFVAEQSEPIRRKVALKVIKPGMDSKQVIARFEAERQALALMDHPNIAKVLDGGTTEAGRPYFVMELVCGIPITEYCDQARLTIRQRLEVFVQVCRAVQHAHTKGVIHRDLKPSNVLVTSHDGIPVPLVIDFGVAKAVGPQLTDRTVYTAHAQMIGTPLYMSPEQAEYNQLGVDTRSDIYSLGVLLYELLTGVTPFDGDWLRTVGYDEFRRILREEEPPRPSARLTTLRPALSTASERRGVDPRKLTQMLHGELDWIVLKSLEKDRDRRYETAAVFAGDVENYLNDEAVEACPPSVTYRLRKFTRRNRRPLGMAAVVTISLAVSTAVSTWQATRAREAQREAEANARSARQAVDKMYLQVAEKWLCKQPLMHDVQKEFLAEVLRYYQEFSLHEMKSRDSRFDAAMANQRAGIILNYGFSDKVQARGALLRALAALKKLSEECPDEPDYLFETARTYAELAQTQHRNSESKDLQEEDLRNSVRLLETLIARSNTEPKYRAALADSLASLCNPMLFGCRWLEAEETARRAIRIFEPLIRESPKPEYFTAMANAYRHLAAALTQQGALPEAIENLRNAIASSERLIIDAAAEPEYQHGLGAFDWHMLGRSYFDLGELLDQSEDLEGAEKALERSVRIYTRIAHDFPTMPDFREALVPCHRKLGQLYKRRGKKSEADAEFTHALTVEKSLRGISADGSKHLTK